MKATIALCQRLFVVVGFTFFLIGCATQPKVDWASRIGNYSYDQAVMNYGPPDKEAKLQDGTVVAQWLTGHGHSYTSTWAPGWYPRWYYDPLCPVYTESYSPNYWLRLIFGPDHRLKEWKEF